MRDTTKPMRVLTRNRRAWLMGALFSAAAGAAFYLATASWIESDAKRRFANHAVNAQIILEARIKSYSDLLRSAGSMFRANSPVSRNTFHDFVEGLNLAQQYPAVEVLNYAENVNDRDREQLEQRLNKEYAPEIAAGLSVAIKPPGRRAVYQVLTVAEPKALLSTVGLDVWGRPELIAAYKRMIDTGQLAHSGKPIPAITRPNHIGLASRLPIYRSDMPIDTVEQRRAAYMGSMGIALSVNKLVKDILGEMRIKNVRMTLIDASPTEQAKTLPALAGGRVLFDSQGTEKLPAPPLANDPDQYFSETVTTPFHGREWKAVFSTSKSDFYGSFEKYLPPLALLAGAISAALLYALYYTLSSSRQRAVSLAGEMTRELRDNEGQLKHSRDQLRRLVAHAEQIKEGERKRIAREIHDDLGQNLLALRIEADMLSSRTGQHHPRLHERAQLTLAQIDATIKSVRQIINDLRPNVLDLGLAAAVEWQVAEFRRRTGIACELVSDNIDVGVVHDHCATAFFRILQESLNNIARHANASAVKVELKLEKAEQCRLSLTVADNGIGLPADGPRAGSFGLVGIEERINLLHGSFLIRSTPGNGTTLSASVPLAPRSHVPSNNTDSPLPEVSRAV
jgi:signal transduction histidine kinase/CHASE1-domain containing sensor protein